jgi:hypothetical protein
VAAVVVSGMAETGPRSAEALSMPGARPVARPALGGGGGENGWAGGTKLVTPGAAGIGVGVGGRISCAIGGCTAVGGTGGGVIRFAFGDGANIPAEDGAGAIDCAGVGGAICCTGAIGWAGTLVAGVETEDPEELTAGNAAAGNAAAGPATALAPELTIPTAACIPLNAALSATEAAATATAAIDPPETAGNDGVINAAPNPSNAAP